MKANLAYLWYVLRHKWFVFVECVRLGIPWRGLVHDLSKFAPREWFPYVAYFYGPKYPHPTTKRFNGEELVPLMEVPAEVAVAFDRAWNWHQKRNRHHWQFWLLSPDRPRPHFGITSHGEPLIYGLNVQHYGTGKIVFYKPPEEVDKDRAVTKLEYVLEDDLNNTPIPLDMPLRDRKEMLADWRGAGRALGKPNTAGWYEGNRRNIVLHPDTRAWIEEQLGVEPDAKHAGAAPPTAGHNKLKETA